MFLLLNSFLSHVLTYYNGLSPMVEQEAISDSSIAFCLKQKHWPFHRSVSKSRQILLDHSPPGILGLTLFLVPCDCVHINASLGPSLILTICSSMLLIIFG